MNKKLAKQISNWNNKYPPGTPVILTDDFGNTHETITRSIAWEICGHASVKVDGRAGGYLLDRIKPVKESRIKIPEKVNNETRN